MNKSSDRLTLKDVLTLFLFLTLISIPIYFAYNILLPKQEDSENENTEETQKEETVPEEEEEEYTGPHYEEVYTEVEGQNAYIAVPARIDSDNPPTIVVYSHGSNTTVTTDSEEEFMQDLHAYGELYTKSNLIFSASNQHGANWGSDEAIQDTLNMINWIKSNYDTEEKIYLLGFSMGGLPTLNFATTYPEMVSKVALLAPTTWSAEWDSERVAKIEDIDIQIWHGTADVNVGYYITTTFLETLESYGREIPLITLEGKTHWDLDTEYMQNVLDFFLL